MFTKEEKGGGRLTPTKKNQFQGLTDKKRGGGKLLIVQERKE